MQMLEACRCIALLALIPLAGCFNGRVIDQSVAAAVASASYHSVNGDWPETRKQLLDSSTERSPLTLRGKDQVWLRENADGSATVTTFLSSWYGRDGMAVRVVPPSHPSTIPQNHATAPDVGDYTIESAMFSKPLGRQLE